MRGKTREMIDEQRRLLGGSILERIGSRYLAEFEAAPMSRVELVVLLLEFAMFGGFAGAEKDAFVAQMNAVDKQHYP
jgi:hypothetical protein